MPLLEFLHDLLGLGDEGDDLEEEDLAPPPPPPPELTPDELAARIARGHEVAPRLRQVLAFRDLRVAAERRRGGLPAEEEPAPLLVFPR